MAALATGLLQIGLGAVLLTMSISGFVRAARRETEDNLARRLARTSGILGISAFALSGLLIALRFA